MRLSPPTGQAAQNESILSKETDQDVAAIDMSSKADVIPYSVVAWSSYSASYHPKNIMTDDPKDQASRWSSGNNAQPQYLILKLERMSVLLNITFGKFMKSHVCNVKEFKIYCGLKPDRMVEVLHNGLRNDSEAETFSVKHQYAFHSKKRSFPCRYVKIVPLIAWSANFNCSIWYIQLSGISDKTVTDRVYRDYMNSREMQVLRLCLKHFRQRGLSKCYETLCDATKDFMRLEEPLISEFYDVIVKNGDYEAADRKLDRVVSQGRDLLQEFVSDQQYRPVWTRLYAKDRNGDTPSMRGGHQMCIDDEQGRIYLFGGWDGNKDLSDLWFYDIASNFWTCVSSDTRKEGGPGPRSCHKMCFDSKYKQIYTFGHYVDAKSAATNSLHPDFWRFDTRDSAWYRISSNTFIEGGPTTIFDHQMCLDDERQIIYVFGGKTATPSDTALTTLRSSPLAPSVPRSPTGSNESSSSEIGIDQFLSEPVPDQRSLFSAASGNVSRPTSQIVYSGLFAFDIQRRIWKQLRPDGTRKPQDKSQLISRNGHSMVLNPAKRELYIFGGQRNVDYLPDFIVYDIENDMVYELTGNFPRHGVPVPGFTIRSTLDADLGELYVFSGLGKDRQSTKERVNSTLWVYSLRKGEWRNIYNSEQASHTSADKSPGTEPIPRYAHQVVYHPPTRRQYMFGGNPSDPDLPNLRLDDFWQLQLLRPQAEDAIRLCQFTLRKQRFKEMCQRKNCDTVQSLRYLQKKVAEKVDHSSPDEEAEFRSLTRYLFNPDQIPDDTSVPFSNPILPAAESPVSSILPEAVAVSPTVLQGSDQDGLLFKVQNREQERVQLFESVIQLFPEHMREPSANLIDMLDIGE